MTDWLPYVRQLADAMGLKDWSFKIDDEVSDDHCDAQIRCIYGQRRAVIRLGAQLDAYDPEKQRGIIAHELIHCHLALIDAAARYVEPALGSVAWPLFEGAMADANEQATDAIAVVLAPFLPLLPLLPVVEEEQEAA